MYKNICRYIHTMATKEELVQNIKAWMKVDQEMKALQKELKERRLLKKNLSASLVDIMKTNEIDCFDITDGKLIYTKNKVKSALSKKHLITSLAQYFKNDRRMADELTKFIMDSRQEKEKENIKRKIKK